MLVAKIRRDPGSGIPITLGFGLFRRLKGFVKLADMAVDYEGLKMLFFLFGGPSIMLIKLYRVRQRNMNTFIRKKVVMFLCYTLYREGRKKLHS